MGFETLNEGRFERQNRVAVPSGRVIIMGSQTPPQPIEEDPLNDENVGKSGARTALDTGKINTQVYLPNAEALWTPAELSTDIWLDAADALTITESGGLVSQWGDKSGNNRHAVQATPALKPRTGAVTINGLNTVDGDGGGSLMISTFAPEIQLNQELHIFQVRQVTNTFPSGGVIFDINEFATGNQTRLTDVGEALFRFVGGVPDGSPLSPPPPLGDRLISSRYSNSSSLLERFVDGNTTPNLSYTFTNPPFSAGDNVDSFYLFCDSTGGDDVTGGMGEVVTILGTLAASNQYRIEGYLAWKWGLEGNLPADHPYKTAPPYV